MGEDAAVPPHRQQAVRVIKRGGEHLLSLIEGTLDIAHIEAGKLTLERAGRCASPTSMQRAGRHVRAAGRGQGPGLPLRAERRAARAWCAPTRSGVRQILINLLGNAIKFTARGPGHVPRCAMRARWRAIEIEDTGPGMSAEELDAHLRALRARRHAPAHAAPGAGLGLTIAKMLTDLMGGEMTVQSTPGAGSVFRVRLFLPRVHERRAGAAPARRRRRARGAATTARAGACWWSTTRRPTASCWCSVLAPLGFELRTAASGHDALDLLAAGYRPDAIFVDLAMPGIDGWETIRRCARAAG